jgi:hypothetical protein
MARRPLSDIEIAEARLVFRSSLDFNRGCVSEDSSWPDWVDRVGVQLHRRVRSPDGHNAITLGQTSFFPVVLNTSSAAITAGVLEDMGWLMHELTHQWQYQRQGWTYLASSLSVQLRLGRAAYDYRGNFPTQEAALQAARADGRRLAQFNLEQQGDLARDYYFRLKAGQNCDAWEPFIAELR